MKKKTKATKAANKRFEVTVHGPGVDIEASFDGDFKHALDVLTKSLQRSNEPVVVPGPSSEALVEIIRNGAAMLNPDDFTTVDEIFAAERMRRDSEADASASAAS
jgi:hypothetical protein